ncbi:uncharacterized protein BDZ99DRAFT_531112 [Mytilinidion resinicola]|uniref:Uncharacterized protein n=1 Tax=Mytilinidion resinicola TaxID=574789 RepID=A0A6A6Z9R4_9PEZI|nr:uncharacterized protein BDZ99DRAFT_531112 [Mytilinidion resinicola]KAF2817872.1 hypothetical protein BDZ99DRAFT_531112 [Mytilinidion resinicola]
MSPHPRARMAKKAKSHLSSNRTPIGGLGQGKSTAAIRRKRRNQRRRYREKRHLRREAAEASPKVQESVEDTMIDAMEGMDIEEPRSAATPEHVGSDWLDQMAGTLSDVESETDLEEDWDALEAKARGATDAKEAGPSQARSERPGMFGRLMAEAAKARQLRSAKDSETESDFEARISLDVHEIMATSLYEARKLGTGPTRGSKGELAADGDADMADESKQEEEGNDSDDRTAPDAEIDMDAGQNIGTDSMVPLYDDSEMDAEENSDAKEDEAASKESPEQKGSIKDPKKPTELLDLPTELLGKVTEYAVGAGGIISLLRNEVEHSTGEGTCMSAKHGRGDSNISNYMALRLVNKRLKEVADKSMFVHALLEFEDLDMFNTVFDNMSEEIRNEIHAVVFYRVEGDSQALRENVKSLPNLRKICFAPPQVDASLFNPSDFFEQECRVYMQTVLISMMHPIIDLRRKHGKRNVELRFLANWRNEWEDYEEVGRRSKLLGQSEVEPLSSHDIQQMSWVLKEDFKQLIVMTERRDLEFDIEINESVIRDWVDENTETREYLAQHE